MTDAKKQKTRVSTENDVTDSVETSALTAEGGACLGGQSALRLHFLVATHLWFQVTSLRQDGSTGGQNILA